MVQKKKTFFVDDYTGKLSHNNGRLIRSFIQHECSIGSFTKLINNESIINFLKNEKELNSKIKKILITRRDDLLTFFSINREQALLAVSWGINIDHYWDNFSKIDKIEILGRSLKGGNIHIYEKIYKDIIFIHLIDRTKSIICRGQSIPKCIWAKNRGICLHGDVGNRFVRDTEFESYKSYTAKNIMNVIYSYFYLTMNLVKMYKLMKSGKIEYNREIEFNFNELIF